MNQITYSILIAVVSASMSADWPQWRGPSFSGASNETALPSELNKKTLLWKTPLPGEAASTPVIADGRVYLSSTQEDSDDVLAMCFDAASGKKQWSKTVPASDSPPRRNTFASCSPVAYKDGAVFLFGNGILVRMDGKGRQVWSRNITDDISSLKPINFGYSSSPLLHDGKLYIPILRQHDPSGSKEQKPYLLCVNADDGKIVFKHTRITDAVKKAHDAYTTPLPAKVNGKTQIIVFGADYLTAHEPDTGEELWRHCYGPEHNDRARLVSSPTIDGNTLVYTAPRGNKTAAVNIEKLASGQPGQLWTYEQKGPDVPCPVLYKGCVYIIYERGKILKCLNAADGTEHWTGELDNSDVYYASITAADDKLYMVNREGTVTVAAADPKQFRILGTYEFDEEPSDSTIAIADGRLFLRTAENVYCFGKK